MNISIVLNGKSIAAGNLSTIMQLLHNHSIDPAHVVVEVNHAIVDKQNYPTCTLHDGDIVEILHFVGGG